MSHRWRFGTSAAVDSTNKTLNRLVATAQGVLAWEAFWRAVSAIAALVAQAAVVDELVADA